MSGLEGKVYFIGAGPGDPELLTLKGKRVIEQADVIIYADSLVDAAVLSFARPDAEIHTSSALTLEQLIDIMIPAARAGKIVARVHTGDPSVYGAIHEQIIALEHNGVECEVVPGVSSAFAAAAALKVELTAPEVSQTVIITRLEGRTPVPGRERLRDLAAHRATMALFLSVGMIENVVSELVAGGYSPTTPVAVVHKASWEDEQKVVGTLSDIAVQVRQSGIDRQAIILVGQALAAASDHKSKLYDKEFSHGYRHGKSPLPLGEG